MAMRGDYSACRAMSPRWLAWLGLVAVAAGLLLPVPYRYPARWVGHVQDLAHVPAFAVVTWSLAVLMRRRAVAIAVAAIVGTAAEWFQPFVGRQASVSDWLLSLAGVGLATVVLAETRRNVAIRAMIAVPLIGVPVAWKSPHLVDAYRFHRAFPVLAAFRSPLERSRWYLEYCRFTWRPGDIGPPYGEFTFVPGAAPSGAILYSFHQDWSAYRHVACEFEVVDRPIRLLFSIRNAGDAIESQHFDHIATYEPGRHVVRLDLADAASGRHAPAVNIRRIQGFYIVAEDSEHAENRTIRVRRIEVE
ncbi:MAG: hypothetical protein FJ297_17190 [Planctomycetes bacterium]|nr:hypothetical protein [Planctomycetota bacterium]